MTERPPVCRRAAALLASALVAAAALAAGCASGAGTARHAGAISGRIRADRIPPDAVVEVYRAEAPAPIPLAGVTARPDALGRFTTPPLVPGRYLLVLRTRESGPATVGASVPSRGAAELRLPSTGGGSSLTLASPPTAPRTRTCRLVAARSDDPVPDRREISLAPGQEVQVAGLAPGTWHLDVLPEGATADLVVPEGGSVPRFVVDPPEQPAVGGTLEGCVFRLRGEPAYGAAVTARTCSPDGRGVEAWGRVANVDREGRYRLERLAPGTAFVRVEVRDARFTVLPYPELIAISPPRPSERAYTVEP